MHKTQHIVPNALVSEPHPNAVVMQQCTVFPVEFVVRGFITGECHNVSCFTKCTMLRGVDASSIEL